MTTHICPSCDTTLVSGLKSWHFKCPMCKYECTNLEPSINKISAHEQIDETSRETGLIALRVSNFKELISQICNRKPSGNLLEVGSAHGWFLRAAGKHFNVLGIEPDEKVYLASQALEVNARNGFFPHALNNSEQFDVIVFNDVIEHISTIKDAIKNCHSRLLSDGLLVINIPNSDGIFYKLSKILLTFGVSSFFERMWQKDLPSPHLHYFNNNLHRILLRNGFTIETTGRLPTVRLSGLYTRISYTGNQNFIFRTLIYLCVAVSIPFLNILPNDITYVIAKKTPSATI